MNPIFFTRAYPKVNISLKVFKKIQNLHPIESRFMLVCNEIFDDMFFVILDSSDSKKLKDFARQEIIFSPNSRFKSAKIQSKDGLYLLGDFNCDIESNLIYKAFRLLKIRKKEILIIVRKNIPFGSGLGGGSVNAALTLLALNKILKLDFSLEYLKQVARVLGSDIIFFIAIYTQNSKDTNKILFSQNLEMRLDDLVLDSKDAISQDFSVDKNIFFSANISGFGEIITPFFESYLPIKLHTNKVLCETTRVYEAFDKIFFGQEVSNKAHIDITLSSEKILYNHNLDFLNDLYLPAVSVYPQLKDIENELKNSPKNMFFNKKVFFSGSGGSFFSLIF